MKTNPAMHRIQHLRTGKAENVKLKTLLSVLHELGYSLKPVAAVL